MAVPHQQSLPFPENQNRRGQDPLQFSKLLLTPAEAAKALSIGRSKLYELLGDGRLSSIRIGACRRVPIAALVEFVARLQDPREPIQHSSELDGR